MKIKEKLIKIAILVIVAIVILGIISSENDSDMSQYLKSINYDVIVNEDGSMKVVETWDIDISHTNTLFKTFELSNKYGEIRDVKVVDLTNKHELEQIDKKMYHVTKGCYYGLEINSREYEIAWGIGMDSQSGVRKYQVSYTVDDVVTDYNDCQEIYWQFLAKGKNAIPAKRVTGTVTLPKNVSDIEKLKVWGHGQINGEIEKISENKVYFELENLRPKAMLEIRVITEDKMFEIENYNKIRNYNYLNTAIKEETNWSNEANNEKEFATICMYIFICIYVIIILINILKIKKYLNLNKQKDDGLIKTNIKYFRDIPRGEDATPAEALYLYKFNKDRLNTEDVQKDAVAATILDLCLKKKISLRIDAKEKVYVKIIDKQDGLKQDELEIYNLLKSVNSKEEFEIEEIKKYAKKEYYKYSNNINKLVDSARNSLYNLKLIDKANEKEYKKYKSAKDKFSVLKFIYEEAVTIHILGYIPFFTRKIVSVFSIAIQSIIGKWLVILLPYLLIKLYSYHLQQGISTKIAVLTQKGSEEKEQWHALKQYIEDYSMISEKEVPELVLWEKYLVYGTAFGIADKVIKQMKAEYPEVFIKENWDENEMQEKYPLITFASNPIYISDNNIIGGINHINRISNNMSKAYNISKTEIAAHASSSSSGGGRWWRILWRWRRPAVVAGRNGWQIKKFNICIKKIYKKLYKIERKRVSKNEGYNNYGKYKIYWSR